MRSNFEEALAFTLEQEGGDKFTNDPKDPGGATKYGITQKTLNAYRVKAGKILIDVKNLSQEVASDIYAQEYWAPSFAGFFPIGVDLAIFDAAVNLGPGRAIRLYQSVLDLKPDGIVGPKTLARVRILNRRPIEIHRDFCSEFNMRRIKYYMNRPHRARFINGWLIRVLDVQSASLIIGIIGDDKPAPGGV